MRGVWRGARTRSWPVLLVALALQAPPPAAAGYGDASAGVPVVTDGGEGAAGLPGAAVAGLSWGSWLGGVATSPGPAAETAWSWPLPGTPAVLRPFDPPEVRWGAGHRGIDLAGAVGQPVTAVDDGVVSFSGRVAGVGVVSVLHPNGVRSTYQPVDPRVARGATVRRGDGLGPLESAGGHCTVRVCLHLGAAVGRSSYLDPLLFLQRWELSLLPLEGVG